MSEALNLPDQTPEGRPDLHVVPESVEPLDITDVLATYTNNIDQKIIPASLTAADEAVKHIRGYEQKVRDEISSGSKSADEDALSTLHDIAEAGTDIWKLSESEVVAYAAIVGAEKVSDLRKDHQAYLTQNGSEPTEEKLQALKAEAGRRLKLAAALRARETEQTTDEPIKVSKEPAAKELPTASPKDMKPRKKVEKPTAKTKHAKQEQDPVENTDAPETTKAQPKHVETAPKPTVVSRKRGGAQREQGPVEASAEVEVIEPQAENSKSEKPKAPQVPDDIWKNLDPTTKERMQFVKAWRNMTPEQRDAKAAELRQSAETTDSVAIETEEETQAPLVSSEQTQATSVKETGVPARESVIGKIIAKPAKDRAETDELLKKEMYKISLNEIGRSKLAQEQNPVIAATVRQEAIDKLREAGRDVTYLELEDARGRLEAAEELDAQDRAHKLVLARTRKNMVADHSGDLFRPDSPLVELYNESSRKQLEAEGHDLSALDSVVSTPDVAQAEKTVKPEGIPEHIWAQYENDEDVQKKLVDYWHNALDDEGRSQQIADWEAAAAKNDRPEYDFSKPVREMDAATKAEYFKHLAETDKERPAQSRPEKRRRRLMTRAIGALAAGALLFGIGANALPDEEGHSATTGHHKVVPGQKLKAKPFETATIHKGDTIWDMEEARHPRGQHESKEHYDGRIKIRVKKDLRRNHMSWEDAHHMEDGQEFKITRR